MKIYLVVFIVLLIASFNVSYAQTITPGIQIQNLYQSPDPNSNIAFSIPIDVNLLELSEDNNWCKVKIGFNFLGRHEYVGWARIK